MPHQAAGPSASLRAWPPRSGRTFNAVARRYPAGLWLLDKKTDNRSAPVDCGHPIGVVDVEEILEGELRRSRSGESQRAQPTQQSRRVEPGWRVQIPPLEESQAARL